MDGAPLASERDEPTGRDCRLGTVGCDPSVGTTVLVDGRRRHDIAAIAADIDAGSNPPLAGLNRAGITEPQMPSATAGDDFARRRQRAMLGLQRIDAGVAAVVGIDVEDPEARDGAGWNGDVAVADAPEASDGLRIRGRGIKATRHRRVLAPCNARKYRQIQGSVVQRRIEERRPGGITEFSVLPMLVSRGNGRMHCQSPWPPVARRLFLVQVAAGECRRAAGRNDWRRPPLRGGAWGRGLRAR